MSQPRYLIGTLFDEEEIKEKTKFQDMKARDDKGHMRWQGAFTGGFTAGYKNTCGSKQGWTPSTFTSSRTKRAQQVKQDISSFMDAQDLGRGELANNINLQSKFQTSENLFNISFKQSIGDRILNGLRKAKAEQLQPENEQQVDKLFQRYAKEQQMEKTAAAAGKVYHFREKSDFLSIGTDGLIENQDPFLNQFQELFGQLVRGRWRQETEQQRRKKKQDNRISWDFTKPLDEDNEYLREIVQQPIEDKPQKRIKTDTFVPRLNQIFTKKAAVKQNQKISRFPQVPQDYNPYRKMEELAKKQQQSKQVEPFRKLDTTSRRQMLGEKVPQIPQVTRQNINSKFVKAVQQQLGCSAELEVYLMNPEKQKRYNDYVLDRQGKILRGDSNLDKQQAQRQQLQFQGIYNKSLEKGGVMNFLPQPVQVVKERNNIVVDKIIRTKSAWRPTPLLCKRFSLLTPYTVEEKNYF